MKESNLENYINKIICGNNLAIMPQIPDGAIDLTVTSPPYDNLRDYHGYTFDFPAIAAELYRVTKDGGVVVWVVGDATINGSETGTSFRQALGFMDIGFRLHDTMIWQTPGFSSVGNVNVRYGQVFEYMFVFSKGSLTTFNPLKDRKNIREGTNKGTIMLPDGSRKRMANEGKLRMEYGQRFNIWQITQVNSNEEHPAMFPDKLAQDHILSWSNEGDIVLDPMCGSGTTCKAAVKLERRYIGIDISPDYCAIAEQRIKAELSQPNLPFTNGGGDSG